MRRDALPHDSEDCLPPRGLHAEVCVCASGINHHYYNSIFQFQYLSSLPRTNIIYSFFPSFLPLFLLIPFHLPFMTAFLPSLVSPFLHPFLVQFFIPPITLPNQLLFFIALIKTYKMLIFPFMYCIENNIN